MRKAPDSSGCEARLSGDGGRAGRTGVEEGIEVGIILWLVLKLGDGIGEISRLRRIMTSEMVGGILIQNFVVKTGRGK